MIKIKPDFNKQVQCPICNNICRFKEIHFTGMRVIAEYECKSCNDTLYTDLPAGHGFYYETNYLEKADKGYIDDKGGQWFLNALKKTVFNRNEHDVHILKKTKEHDKLVILSAVDSYFGHAVLRLMTSAYYKREHSDTDILLIYNKQLKWMVPEFIDNLIECSIPFKLSEQWIINLDSAVREIADAYESVYIATDYAHLYKNKQIEVFTGIPVKKPEDIFLQKNPCIGFIWREDRLWIDNERLSQAANIIRKRLGIDVSALLIRQQYNKIMKCMKIIRKQYPQGRIYIAGFGKQMKFPKWVEDMRVLKPSEETEKIWCERYSNTTITIGLHGSNMILPSAYSAMVLDIIPEWKWYNVLEDIIIQRSDNPYDTLFRYRMIPKKTTTSEIASIAVSMIQYYNKFKSKFSL